MFDRHSAQSEALGQDGANEPLLERQDNSISMSSLNGEDAHDATTVAVDNDEISEKLASTTGWQAIDSHSFIPSLEGIRGIAVVFAHLCHIFRQSVLQDIIGTVGVTIFFVLSGFLITGVLMRSQAKSKSTYAHIPRFYADRAVRLWPALFFMVGVMIPIFLWTGWKATDVFRSSAMALFYLTNIESLRFNGSSGCFPATWSLACEEHFYILWSLILPFVCRAPSRLRMAVLAVLIGVSLFAYVQTGLYPGSIFGIYSSFNSLENFWKMLLGASLRLLPVPPTLMKRRWAYIGLISMIAMLALVSHLPGRILILGTSAPGWKHNHYVAARCWADSIAAICTLLIICGVHDERGGPMILETQFLRFGGRVSYAWYLWQLPTAHHMAAVKKGTGISYGATAVAFMVAMFSTIYIEEPIRAAYVAWKARRNARATSLEASVP